MAYSLKTFCFIFLFKIAQAQLLALDQGIGQAFQAFLRLGWL